MTTGRRFMLSVATLLAFSRWHGFNKVLDTFLRDSPCWLNSSVEFPLAFFWPGVNFSTRHSNSAVVPNLWVRTPTVGQVIKLRVHEMMNRSWQSWRKKTPHLYYLKLCLSGHQHTQQTPSYPCTYITGGLFLVWQVKMLVLKKSSESGSFGNEKDIRLFSFCFK